MNASCAAPEGAVNWGSAPILEPKGTVSGRFVDRDGERFYVIEHAERMPPFFTCAVSASDHWLFASSNGCLTAGRQNSANALFPYVTEDKIRDNVHTTGPYTALLVERNGVRHFWEPFRESSALVYDVQLNLYKSCVGDRLVFEEINESLGVAFAYEWCTSQRYGFVRRSSLREIGGTAVAIRVVDGVKNLLPACVDEQMQLGFSSLLDAYKVAEHVGPLGLSTFSLAAQIVDRAEPREALRATVAFGVGLPSPQVLLCTDQLCKFARGQALSGEKHERGKRAAYFQAASLGLEAGQTARWTMVFDVRRDQLEVEQLLQSAQNAPSLLASIDEDVARGTGALRAIVADTDGLQLSADEATTQHHFANTLFNDMRGGVYADGYRVQGPRFAAFVRGANRAAHDAHQQLLKTLPDFLDHADLMERVEASSDPVLCRLGQEYLPLTFSRRHGDPSRPWNKFDIKVRDESGQQLLAFQGNWRDIFQNWEALSTSYPEYVESIIAKFVNASTLDGYNPYRITESGIDWEVPEPENPWAGIGYWGDHQIVYLLKLLELSRAHHPERLGKMLLRSTFTYANVPYRIRGYESIKSNPHDTIVFDRECHEKAEALCGVLGADGKLVQRGEGSDAGPVMVSLLEKLIVASLAKMGNYVPGGGIWMNTQRPEWNDANNALVGHGVSMVTLYYLARFFHFLDDLVASLEGREVRLSSEVATWLAQTTNALAASSIPEQAGVDERDRFSLVEALGRSSSTYRERVYAAGPGQSVELGADVVRAYVAECRRHLTHTVRQGRREGGLYHAYNLLSFVGERLRVEPLYEMLEGQVAVLSSGVLSSREVIEVLAALRRSSMYREDQRSYMLYPNRELPGFLEKNRVPEVVLNGSPVLQQLLDEGSSIARRDVNGVARFGADLFNAERLEQAMSARASGFSSGESSPEALAEVRGAYEATFHHHAFTGRSGTMFGYEGLGSIYWHMVAKLLLAVQENYFWGRERGAPESEISELRERYYDIRSGVGGFNKTPEMYGAFIVDPYSHTPENSGARQPGMTGQVKEEILTRFGELGVRVQGGRISFEPSLLRESEFLTEAAELVLTDRSGALRRIAVPSGALAFTYAGTPIVVHRSGSSTGPASSTGEGHRIELLDSLGNKRTIEGTTLDVAMSSAMFRRSGEVQRIDVFTSDAMR